MQHYNYHNINKFYTIFGKLFYIVHVFLRLYAFLSRMCNHVGYHHFTVDTISVY